MITKTLPSNSIQTSLDGLDFDASNETWIINPGVTVSTQTGLGVSSDGFVNTTLINHGTVESGARRVHDHGALAEQSQLGPAGRAVAAERAPPCGFASRARKIVFRGIAAS